MTTDAPAFTLSSPAFANAAPIPRRYTEDGLNISPPLAWSNLPPGTQQLALIVDDPDAPRPEPWVHWLIYCIPATTTNLPEQVAPAQRVNEPAGARQGINSWNRLGYGGPAPPKGHGRHRYFFRLYALGANLQLDPGATKAQLLAAMDRHTLAHATLIGTYERE